MKKTASYDSAREVMTIKYSLFGLTFYTLEVSTFLVRSGLIGAPNA